MVRRKRFSLRCIHEKDFHSSNQAFVALLIASTVVLDFLADEIAAHFRVNPVKAKRPLEKLLLCLGVNCRVSGKEGL